MADEDQSKEVAEESEGGKSRFHMSKFALLVGLPSVVIGIVVLSLVAGGVYCLKKTSALQSEVTALKKDIKERTRSQDDLREQIDVLKRDVLALSSKREMSEETVRAVSREVAGQVAKEIAGEAAKEAAKEATKEILAREMKSLVGEGKPEPAIPPKTKRPGGDGFSCDITGKSPEEQAAILKRCVGAMDSPPKTRPATR